jgi:selenide,water dikinase
VLTTDFFTPIVDDPYTFGAIAAANALSDVYSMGGRAFSALAIAAFPDKKYPVSVLIDITQGAVDKCAEGGCVLIGGHTVKDDELKFGLAVVGEVHPQRIITNARARAGDLLLLTKPLGTGIISTALKGDVADRQAVEMAIANMLLLNAGASEIIAKMGVVCVTDITGFGLLGHSWEMAKASGVSMAFDVNRVPVLPEAIEYAEMGLVPGGLACNREFVGDRLVVSGDIAKAYLDLLFDPQTSGGLLICSPPDNAEEMVKKLGERGYPQTAIIGEVLAESGKLIVR